MRKLWVCVCVLVRIRFQDVGVETVHAFFCFAVFAYLFTYHPRSPCSHTISPNENPFRKCGRDLRSVRKIVCTNRGGEAFPPLPPLLVQTIFFFYVSPYFCIPLYIQKQMGHDCRTYFQHFRSNYRVRSMGVGVCMCVGVLL